MPATLPEGEERWPEHAGAPVVVRPPSSRAAPRRSSSTPVRSTIPIDQPQHQSNEFVDQRPLGKRLHARNKRLVVMEHHMELIMRFQRDFGITVFQPDPHWANLGWIEGRTSM